MSWVTLVALLAEGVDRNFNPRINQFVPTNVALLAEGVDRNSPYPSGGAPSPVALLAEGVDRNWFFSALFKASKCRPPRGGRG